MSNRTKQDPDEWQAQAIDREAEALERKASEQLQREMEVAIQQATVINKLLNQIFPT